MEWRDDMEWRDYMEWRDDLEEKSSLPPAESESMERCCGRRIEAGGDDDECAVPRKGCEWRMGSVWRRREWGIRS
eukprot:4648741-Pleurochrysis_carterae.AAC.1